MENPELIKKYDIPFKELLEKIKELPANFPDEYKIVEEDTSQIKMLVLPTSPMASGSNNDLLIIINGTPEGAQYIATNEFNEIKSYNEQDRNEKALNTTTELVDKSINNTLMKANFLAKIEEEKRSGKVHPIIQLSMYIAVMIVLFGIINTRGCIFP